MHKKPKCKYCNSINIIKKGIRKQKLQSKQIYQCKDCSKKFALQQTKHITYPITTILKAISTYNLGYNLKQTQERINKKLKTKIPVSTISSWLNQYKDICIYNKLRSKAIKLYTPKNIIFKQILNHIQPYTFKYHKAKLELLFKDIKYNNQFINQSKFYEPIKNYLQKIKTDKFPHHIFKEKTGSDADVAKLKYIDNKKLEQRASQIKFARLKIKKLEKTNLANKLAKLALNLATTNKERHQIIQDFMLINDSTTIAVEVPVYLTNDDIKYFLKKGFKINFSPDAEIDQLKNKFNNKNNAITALEQRSLVKTSSSDADIAKSRNTKLKNKLIKTYRTPITGHIDILQVRNGLIHILDYKPEADKTNPINQLTLYALALASRTKLAVKDFKAAWFDEKTYFEFFPLHGVYEKLKN